MAVLAVGKTYVGIEHGSKDSKPLVWVWNHCVGADESKIGLNLGSKDGLPLFHFGWNCTGAAPVEGRIYLGIEHGSKDSKPLVWVPCCLSPPPPPPPPPPVFYDAYCCDNVSQQIQLPATIYGTTKYGTFPMRWIPVHLPGSGGGEIRHGWYSDCLSHGNSCIHFTLQGASGALQVHVPISYRLFFFQSTFCVAGVWGPPPGTFVIDQQHPNCFCRFEGSDLLSPPTRGPCPVLTDDPSDPNYGLTTYGPEGYFQSQGGSCEDRVWEFSVPNVGQLICADHQLFLPGDTLIIHET